jgi:hypothetical protein
MMTILTAVGFAAAFTAIFLCIAATLFNAKDRPDLPLWERGLIAFHLLFMPKDLTTGGKRLRTSALALMVVSLAAFAGAVLLVALGLVPR